MSYKTPGVYREELVTLPPAVLRTGVPVFLGYTEYQRCDQIRGAAARAVEDGRPQTGPCRLTLWADFEQMFGQPVPGGYLSHAVRGFFENGGQLCYVMRLGDRWSDDRAGREAALCRGLQALQPASDIDLICAPDIMAPLAARGAGERAPAADLFDGVTPNDALEELLAMQGFILYHCYDLGDRFAILDSLYGASVDRVLQQRHELERQVRRCDMVGAPAMRGQPKALGLAGEAASPEAGAAPPQASGEVLADLPQQGPRTMRDVPRALRAAEMRGEEPWLPGNNGALYYPWIRVLDGPATTAGFVPPCGHVAGIISQWDQRVGVHRAPANEVVAGALDLERDLTDTEQGRLNPEGVNALRSFRGRGIRVWGARTLSHDQQWIYISVRRIFLTAVRWIERNMAQVVFEPHDQRLWGRIERDLTVYFNGLFRQGALKGATPQEAFYVRCNEHTNPPELRDRGQVVTEIGLAPALPNEFIVIRLVQSASGATIEGPSAA